MSSFGTVAIRSVDLPENLGDVTLGLSTREVRDTKRNTLYLQVQHERELPRSPWIDISTLLDSNIRHDPVRTGFYVMFSVMPNERLDFRFPV